MTCELIGDDPYIDDFPRGEPARREDLTSFRESNCMRMLMIRSRVYSLTLSRICHCLIDCQHYSIRCRAEYAACRISWTIAEGL